MRKINFIPLMALLFIVGACGEQRETDRAEAPEETRQEFQDPEDARTGWIDAWNNRDVQKIQTLAATDAVLVLNGREVPIDSIPGFYQGAGSQMKDLEMKTLKKGSTDNIAYDTGTYTHSYTNDTTRHQGSYTFIWERGDDDSDWKVKAMNISDEVNYQQEN